MTQLLELARGASEEQLDHIEQTIAAELQAARNDQEFKSAINAKLNPLDIYFTDKNPTLNKTGAMAFYSSGRVVIGLPMFKKPLDTGTVKHLAGNYRLAISHELVHHAQHQAAQKTGSATKLSDYGERQQLPGGGIDVEQYRKDPHENMAQARTEIDALRARGLSRDEIMLRLKHGKSTFMYSPADRKRFFKNAYRYAAETRAQQIVANLLER